VVTVCLGSEGRSILNTPLRQYPTGVPTRRRRAMELVRRQLICRQQHRRSKLGNVNKRILPQMIENQFCVKNVLQNERGPRKSLRCYVKFKTRFSVTISRLSETMPRVLLRPAAVPARKSSGQISSSFITSTLMFGQCCWIDFLKTKFEAQHAVVLFCPPCPSGGTGRRAGLKIQ
jgi:hypothetical protein